MMRAIGALGSLLGAIVWTTGCANGPYEYRRCTSDTDCSGRAHCQIIDWRDGAGSVCTHACTTMSECPLDGRCLEVSRDGFFCFEPCTADPDCPSGYLCQPLSQGGAVCLPNDGA